MIDFSKLRSLTLAEREANEKSRIAQDIVDDLARRQERSRRTVNLKLRSDAEFRHTMSGGRLFILRGVDERGRTASAHWHAPDHFEVNAVNALFEQLAEGATVRLEGYWKARDIAGVKRFEFVAQFFTIADGSRTPCSPCSHLGQETHEKSC